MGAGSPCEDGATPTSPSTKAADQAWERAVRRSEACRVRCSPHATKRARVSSSRCCRRCAVRSAPTCAGQQTPPVECSRPACVLQQTFLHCSSQAGVRKVGEAIHQSRRRCRSAQRTCHAHPPPASRPRAGISAQPTLVSYWLALVTGACSLNTRSTLSCARLPISGTARRRSQAHSILLLAVRTAPEPLARQGPERSFASTRPRPQTGRAQRPTAITVPAACMSAR